MPGPALSIPPLSDRDLRLLQTFRAVADAGGLTAAERGLGVERTTISRRVKLLEERLGGPLCQRGPQGFELTEFGRAALAAADDLADAMANARNRLAAARGSITGELRLGVADTCLTNPEARIAETLDGIARRAPYVVLHVAVDAPSRLIEALGARRFHAVISGHVPGNVRLEVTPLFDEWFRLFVAARAPLPPPHVSELRGLGYGAVLRGAERSPAGLAVARLGLDHQASASGLEAVATLIATGRYVGHLPTHLPHGLARGHRFAEVRGAETFALRTEFMLITERDRPIGAVLDVLRSAAIEAHTTTRPLPGERGGCDPSRTTRTGGGAGSSVAGPTHENQLGRPARPD